MLTQPTALHVCSTKCTNGTNSSTNGNRVNYIFIFEPKSSQIEDAHLAAESSGLKNRIYLDTACVFRADNAFMPSDNKYHTVLVNENDSIVLIGNPKSNKKVEAMFLDIINN